MEKIPTAKLFRETKLMDSSKPYTEEEIMIEFTKLHVEAALKEASEKAKTKMEWWTDLGGGEHEEVTVNKNSIKKSYSLDNIK